MAAPRRPRSRRPATTEAEPPTTEGEPLAAPHPDAPELLQGEEDGEPETGPLRRCVVTRERLAKERMIRFVLSPERIVVPDLAARLPGRGIWLSARGDVLETARAQGSLARAFARHAARGAARDDAADAAKGAVTADVAATNAATAGLAIAGAKAAARAGRVSVTLPPDLPELIEAMLLRRVVELLGLARRAGQAVCGFQKAREWLTSNRAGLVLQASDGSVDERARFLSGVTAANLAEPGDTAGGAGAADDTSRVAVPVGTPLSAASLGAVFGRDHVVHVVVAPGRLAEALTNEIARLYGVTRRAEPGLKDAQAGRKAAGGDAGKTMTGQTGTGQTGTGAAGSNKWAGA